MAPSGLLARLCHAFLVLLEIPMAKNLNIEILKTARCTRVFTDRVSREGKAIGSVCLSVCLSV